MADEVGEVPSSDTAEPFFAPDRADLERQAPRGGLRVYRLAIRVVVCILALAALDHLITPMFAPPATYLDHYRLPRSAPTAALADYVSAIDLASRVPDRPPIAIFLGASPTFGHRIKDPRHTFPYAYASAAASAGVPVTAFNLAANGQFVGDYLVLAKRLAVDADIVFVQLTYHTFSPAARGASRIRYPELPAVLGVELTTADAKLLGLQAGGGTVSSAPPVALGGTLSRWWTLWRERDLIDGKLLGGSPRDALTALVGRVTGTAPAPTAAATTTILPEDSAEDGFASFAELDPGMQMVAIARYAEESSFTIDATDGEIVLLDRLAADLAAAHKKAVFFMGPLNREVIDSYGLIDAVQYGHNIGLIRAAVERHGFSLIDPNTGEAALPGSDFADISHTTDTGGARFGALLLTDTLSYLRTVTP